MSAARVALVSDIHGNAVALRALVTDLERQGADQVVCLGDVSQGGPQPAEVTDTVLAQGWATVMGNSDAFLLDPDAGDEPVTPRLLEVREWSCAQLGPERLELIAGYSPTIELSLDGSVKLLAFHGSPRSFDEILLPSLGLEEHREALSGNEADVFAGGHVHLQWLRRLGSSVFVNPGSVGLSYDHDQPEDDFRFDPWAAYALLTVDEAGSTEIAFRRVPFDRREVISALEESGMPHGDDSTWRWEPQA
jgi:predicted phosphodiesterase